MDDYQFAKMYQIFYQNRDTPFVQRLLDPDKFPPPILNPDNSYSTHKMVWGSSGDKYVVFPTIFPEGKTLKEYDSKNAFQKAMKTKDYIEFDKPEDAEWFSKNYKMLFPAFQ